MTIRFLPLATLLSLLALAPASARVRISEFVASNQTGHLDRDGDAEDWLELYNDGVADVNLGGWSLTDDATELRKWIIPEVILPADGYLVIFASGENRRTPGEELHTDFSLSKSGEYLALVGPDGVTVEDEYAPGYPAQFEDVSFGLSQTGQTTATVVSLGASGSAGVPASAADFAAEFAGWSSNITGAFNGSTWRAVSSGVGVDQAGTLGTWLGAGGDFETELLNQNGSIFLRLPFTVANPGAVTRLTLRMRWDDGFIAYLNGTQVAANRAPAAPDWDSLATSDRGVGENDDWISFPIDLLAVTLQAGQNLLAIHGLNDAVSSPDLLVLPELDLTTGGVAPGGPVYHSTPTPGAPNGTGATVLPPLLTAVTSRVDPPLGGGASEPITVTALVRETVAPITQVRLLYRIMFAPERALAMADDGVAPDELAGDGIFTVALPTVGVRGGQMLRWRVEARDSAARVSRDPAYDIPSDSDRYYGTVAQDGRLRPSKLPILHTFVENESAVNTRSGGRVGVYYLGEFYDNVQMDLHGQSTAGGAFPKKSYDLDFNKGNRFLWQEGERKVKDINLLTNYADKSKVRNTMAYEFLKRCGAGYHFAFPVRVQRNGFFYSVQDMVEDGDDRYLDRIGLDGNGALYKMYDRMENASRASKKTRKNESNADLSALISRLNPTLSRDSRRRIAYDLLNIPGCVNYLASLTVAGITDAGHKNYYMYRDTEGTGEWHPLPWDVDLSAGRRWTGGEHYFHDPLHSNFWNASTINRLWDLIHNTPDYRDMYLRRVQTLRAELLLPPGTPVEDDWFTLKVRELEDLIDPVAVRSDADLDLIKWGSWGNGNDMREASERLLTEWLPPRRAFMFSNSRNQGGVRVPAPQPAAPNVTVETIDFNPVSGNQDEEYFELKNNENASVDLSGWILSGAVDFVIPPGTVIPAGLGTSASRFVGLLHVARVPKTFRMRRTRPRSGQFRLIVGGYEGQLSARGETIELRTDQGVLVASETYPGDPSPTQLALRIMELNYHPAPPTPEEEDVLPGVIAEEFEWIEFLNIGASTLDLENVRFTNGIDYTFGQVSLPAGERLILAKNPVAFALRHPEVTATVLGPYLGFLNNDGEPVRLVDGMGENIENFDFNDRWYPSSDGAGRTLVLRDEEIPWNDFDEVDSWGSSIDEGGSAGEAGQGYQTHFNAWQVMQFTSAERADPEVGTALANPDGDRYPNWQEYAFGLDPRTPDQATFQSQLVSEDKTTYLGALVRLRSHAADLQWKMETSTDGVNWKAAAEVSVTLLIPHGDGTQTMEVREFAPVGTSESKLARLRISFAP